MRDGQSLVPPAGTSAPPRLRREGPGSQPPLLRGSARHSVYSLGDGGALAFFAFADDEVYQKCQAASPAEIGNFQHVAFKVADDSYDELVSRLKTAGQPVRETDHGYCRSMYCTSPDGLIVEFTVDPADADQIDALRRADAHSELARWVAGDHHTNNELRTHEAA
jgi:glyoxylase I family protein